MRKNEEGGIVLKLDFAKAYDNIDWSFLLDLLVEMGFGAKWVRWMEECVTTASLAVLVNGSPTDFFKIEKGLRQGDPLSPLLFNICINGLLCMLNKLGSNDTPVGFHIGNGLCLNHLQFADER
ncbi:secreted RxLR effector protein 78-like [Lotus japonicus]|uniref:secreted RxLR effector protein 78-like n=1 Tax=Lotus japonicus TaxID=34305 RepID=UPI0025836786|nr:secreted RxLR effector protein 78-like [Lotus japonicus]